MVPTRRSSQRKEITIPISSPSELSTHQMLCMYKCRPNTECIGGCTGTTEALFPQAGPQCSLPSCCLPRSALPLLSGQCRNQSQATGSPFPSAALAQPLCFSSCACMAGQKGPESTATSLFLGFFVMQQIFQSLLLLLPLPFWKECVGLFTLHVALQLSQTPSTFCSARCNAMFVPGKDNLTECHVHSLGLKVKQGDWPKGKEVSPFLHLNKESRKHQNKDRAGKKPLVARQGEEAWFSQYLPSRAQRTVLVQLTKSWACLLSWCKPSGQQSTRGCSLNPPLPSWGGEEKI